MLLHSLIFLMHNHSDIIFFNVVCGRDTLFLEDFSLPDMIIKFEEHIEKDTTASLVSVYTCNKEGNFRSILTLYPTANLVSKNSVSHVIKGAEKPIVSKLNGVTRHHNNFLLHTYFSVSRTAKTS